MSGSPWAPRTGPGEERAARVQSGMAGHAMQVRVAGEWIASSYRRLGHLPRAGTAGLAMMYKLQPG